MNVWSDRVTQFFSWKGALPRRLGLQHVYIHVSAILALPLAGFSLATLLKVWPELDELQTAAITLPIVWIVSLSVRLAAQLLAIGSHGDEFEMVVGPVGNLSHEYEQLSGPAMLAYAVAGQASTLLMGLLGVLVLGAITNSPSNGVTLANLLDLQTGWSANAWASQLVWVNGFLFLLHMLPAAPFDARAFFVGWCHVSSPTMSAGAIHRSLATTDSMIGCSLGGFSVAMIVTRMADMDSAAIWCVLLVVAIYLLSVSRIEQFQALQDDELSEPPLPRVWRQRPRPVGFGNELQELGEFDTFQAPSAHEVLDVDEILRKLHREGQDALSAFEKEALLSASRELQARRQSRSAGGR